MKFERSEIGALFSKLRTAVPEVRAVGNDSTGILLSGPDAFATNLELSIRAELSSPVPQGVVNMQNELIFSLRSNSCFRLEDVSDETQLKAKILEWLTRTAIKGISPKERKLHFEGINKLLGTNFTLEEMTDIYTYLGNGIKHDLCVKFVESGYDMTIIQKEG